MQKYDFVYKYVVLTIILRQFKNFTLPWTQTQLFTLYRNHIFNSWKYKYFFKGSQPSTEINIWLLQLQNKRYPVYRVVHNIQQKNSFRQLMNPLLPSPHNKLEILNLNRNVILFHEFGILKYIWRELIVESRIQYWLTTNVKLFLFFPLIGHSVSLMLFSFCKCKKFHICKNVIYGFGVELGDASYILSYYRTSPFKLLTLFTDVLVGSVFRWNVSELRVLKLIIILYVHLWDQRQQKSI